MSYLSSSLSLSAELGCCPRSSLQLISILIIQDFNILSKLCPLTICTTLYEYLGLAQWLSSTESACNAGGLQKRQGVIPQVENSNPLQYFCLENLTGRGAWRPSVVGVTKQSNTMEWLNNNDNVSNYSNRTNRIGFKYISKFG